jgi:hypothetical protein
MQNALDQLSGVASPQKTERGDPEIAAFSSTAI